jgi:hypothetical protein
VAWLPGRRVPLPACQDLAAAVETRPSVIDSHEVKVEPLPPTVEALRELTRQGDKAVALALWRISRDVQRIVPEIVGLSLSFVEENLTFTMTATAGPVAELDAMQYLDGGPCEETLRTGEATNWRAGNPADEDQWQIFARATSAAGVQSTLSLPIMRKGVVAAGVNLYASTSDAFDGRHDELAEVCGAWAGGAVTNADLDFATRFAAAETPARLRAEQLVDEALGALLGRSDVEPAEAEQRLRDAARRAGITDAQMARAILDLLGDGDDTGRDFYRS